MSTTTEGSNRRRDERPHTPPGRPAADSCFRVVEHSIEALRRVTALVFPSGELVETDAWLASHADRTPSSELYVDPSGLVLCRRVSESTEEEES